MMQPLANLYLHAISSGALKGEIERALREIEELQDMEQVVAGHGKNLAELFTSKSGKDEIETTQGMVKDVDAKFEAALNASAMEIAQQFERQRAEYAGQLGHLGAAVTAKADTVWMESLENSIREEMERLRKAGGKGITKKELERLLAELRAKIDGMSTSTEMGAAAFRCIACDRPLPTADKWSKEREARRRNALAKNVGTAGRRGEPSVRLPFCCTPLSL